MGFGKSSRHNICHLRWLRSLDLSLLITDSSFDVKSVELLALGSKSGNAGQLLHSSSSLAPQPPTLVFGIADSFNVKIVELSVWAHDLATLRSDTHQTNDAYSHFPV